MIWGFGALLTSKILKGIACYRNFNMLEIKTNAPLKVLIENFTCFEKCQNDWMFKLSNENFLKNISKIHIQGEIIRTAGFSNEILIINDGTGKAKITRGSNVPGNLAWVNAGIHCSVVGTLIENGKLPVIAADKIAEITNQILVEMWPWEVKDLMNILGNKTFPNILENDAPITDY